LVDAEKCFLQGVELANLLHEGLDDILLGRRVEGFEKINKAQVISDQSECVGTALKTTIRQIAQGLRISPTMKVT